MKALFRSESNLESLIPFFLFIFTFAFYSLTVCPTVYWLDSGEFTAAIACVGLPHSPAFPAFILSALFLKFLPLGDVSARANLASVLYGSLLVVSVYRVFIRFCSDPKPSTNRFIGTVIALCVALNPLIWFQSIKVEVYPLNVFLQLLIIYFAGSVIAGKSTTDALRYKYLLVALFFFGIGCANHLLLTAHLFPIVGWMMIIMLRRIRFSQWILAITGFLSGISVYIYLPIRSAVNPDIDIGNPEKIINFINCVTRRGSFDRFFGNEGYQWLVNISGLIDILKDAFPGSVLVMVTASALIWMLGSRMMGISLFLVTAVNIGITLMNKNFNINPDTGPAYLMLSIIILLLGFGWFLTELFALSRSLKMVKKTIWVLVLAASGWLLFDGTINSIGRIKMNSLAEDYSAWRIGSAILENCENNSIIFTGFYTNLRFVFASLQTADRFREDIRIYDRSEIAYWPGGLERFWAETHDDYVKETSSVDEKKLEYLIPRGVRHSTEIPQSEALEIILSTTANIATSKARSQPVYWMPSEDDYLLGNFIRAEGLQLKLLSRSGAELSPGPDPSVWMRYVDRIQVRESEFINSSGSKILVDSLVNLANTMDNIGAVATAYLIYQSALLINPESDAAKFNFELIRQKIKHASDSTPVSR